MTQTKLEVLTPQNSQIIFIDHQPQMAFGVQSIDRQVLKNNTVGLAKAAKVFRIPTTITTAYGSATATCSSSAQRRWRRRSFPAFGAGAPAPSRRTAGWTATISSR